MKSLTAKIFSALLALTAPAINLSAQYIPNSRYAGKFDPTPVKMPRQCKAPQNEMRGVWMATIFNLDYPRPTTVKAFKKFFSNSCKRLAEHGFNAIFFQVRPANDAFYISRLNPWSRFLSGAEGLALSGEKNFDPLQYMISEAHRHGLQFHAWLNPYRVVGATNLSKTQYLKTLAENNFARRNPHLVMESPATGKARTLVLNPAEPQVRQFVTATVMEIVRKYKIASIHFDDYFYPENTTEASDRAAYKKYNPNKLPLAQWRRNNVTMLIRSISSQIRLYNKQHKKNVRFGISPFGIWCNRKTTPAGSLSAGRESYSDHYADTRLWIKQRLIDYIVPQIYWNFNHDAAPYAALTDWWCNTVRNSGVDLYIGQAAYQLGKSGWNLNELYYQMLYNRTRTEVKGSIIFSYRNLAAPENKTMQRGAREMLKHFWRR